MRKGLFILLFFFNASFLFGQVKDSSLVQIKDSIPVKDSSFAITQDTLNISKTPDSILSVVRFYNIDTLLNQNIFLNTKSKSQSYLQTPHKYISKDGVFYILLLILLFLGIIKTSYQKYFGNLIRVFFNTSLRQGQLTDQLLQAKLPSIFFNFFFVVTAGWYVFILLSHFKKVSYNNWNILLICVAAVALIYFTKYLVLKFTGWLTGYKQEADTYIFIVFLVNKMVAVCLVPVIVILPFAQEGLVNVMIIVSYILILFFLIIRFIRAFGLLQNRLKFSGFHFFLYTIGIELLPVLLIYKGVILIMSKSL